MTEDLQEMRSQRKNLSVLPFPSPPALRLEEYFAGETGAIGLFHDRFGRLRRQFSAEMVGTVEGDSLRLHEVLAYNDGEQETREWLVKQVGANGYEGTCENVVGTARGEASGNTFRWQYDFQLRVGQRLVTMRFDDAMYLQAGGLLINRVKVSKFGLLVGECTIVFFKDAAQLGQAFWNQGAPSAALKAAAE